MGNRQRYKHSISPCDVGFCGRRIRTKRLLVCQYHLPYPLLPEQNLNNIPLPVGTYQKRQDC